MASRPLAMHPEIEFVDQWSDFVLPGGEALAGVEARPRLGVRTLDSDQRCHRRW